jgi:hypothetical protein
MSEATETPADDALLRALLHELRVEIVQCMERQGSISPAMFTEEYSGSDEVSVSRVGYHFGVLASYDVIELVGYVDHLGATERVYALNPKSPLPAMLRGQSR